MRTIFALILSVIITTSCNSLKKNEVKNPFSAKKYQSNGRFFRANASGQSINLETSRDKAMLSAKQRLASSVQTQIKNVTENYQNERNIENNLNDFGQRFQQLTREVGNQLLFDVTTIGEKTFRNKDNSYTTYIALEARKKTIYKKLKDIAKANATLSNKDKAAIEEMIDKAIADTNDND